ALGCIADGGVLQQMLHRADARLLLALLILRGVVAAVLLEVALFPRSLDALRDLFAARGRELLEFGGEAVVRLLCEEGHLGVRHVDSPSGGWAGRAPG